MKYLLAGPEEPGSGRLLVTTQSVVVPWTPQLALFISENLRSGCPGSKTSEYNSENLPDGFLKTEHS